MTGLILASAIFLLVAFVMVVYNQMPFATVLFVISITCLYSAFMVVIDEIEKLKGK